MLARVGLSGYLCQSVCTRVVSTTTVFQMSCISDFLCWFAKILRHDY